MHLTRCCCCCCESGRERGEERGLWWLEAGKPGGGDIGFTGAVVTVDGNVHFWDQRLSIWFLVGGAFALHCSEVV